MIWDLMVVGFISGAGIALCWFIVNFIEENLK